MRKERKAVEQALMLEPEKRAAEIALELGTSTDYVRGVRRELTRRGLISRQTQGTDAERLADLMALFNKREGKIGGKMAYTMLMHNCYYRLRSQDDKTHATAIENTYAINDRLKHPLPIMEVVMLCEIAVDHYMKSIDAELNEKAKALGYPGAGLHYSDRAIKEIWAVEEHELPLVYLR